MTDKPMQAETGGMIRRGLRLVRSLVLVLLVAGPAAADDPPNDVYITREAAAAATR